MKIRLNSENDISIDIEGSVTMIEYSWLVKPLSILLKNFENTDVYFNKLFDLLYKIKEWALLKKAKFVLKASSLFKATFYLFCKSRESEE